VGQQRECLLDRKKHPLHVRIEDRIENLLGDGAQGAVPRNARIRKDDIEFALVSVDLSKQAIKIIEFRNVSLYSGDISADFAYRRVQLRLPASRDERVGAFPHKTLCGR